MKSYKFKTANMKKEQDFTLYPYTGGDYIYLQSDKRFSRFNLRTGQGFINARGRNYANSIDLQICPIPATLPEHIKLEIQAYLWHNDGKQGNIGGVCYFDNKPLFSTQD